MIKLGLVGEGISQSQSPDLHGRLGKLLSIPVEYQLFDAKGEADFSLSDQIQMLIQAGYRGVNITFPFKEKALTLANTMGHGAQLVGSSNTLLFENGQVRAENTDFTGFIKAYQQTFQQLAPGRVLIIGAGGVGRAVAAGLGQLRCEELFILEPDSQRANNLATVLIKQGLKVTCVSPAEAAQLIPNLNGIVNCSPVGHVNHPGCPIDPLLLHNKHWVFDAVYIPAQTELLRACINAGGKTLSGVDLFVYQGIAAFQFFTNVSLDEAELASLSSSIREHYSLRLNEKSIAK